MANEDNKKLSEHSLAEYTSVLWCVAVVGDLVVLGMACDLVWFACCCAVLCCAVLRFFLTLFILNLFRVYANRSMFKWHTVSQCCCCC